MRVTCVSWTCSVVLCCCVVLLCCVVLCCVVLSCVVLCCIALLRRPCAERHTMLRMRLSCSSPCGPGAVANQRRAAQATPAACKVTIDCPRAHRARHAPPYGRPARERSVRGVSAQRWENAPPRVLPAARNIVHCHQTARLVTPSLVWCYLDWRRVKSSSDRLSVHASVHG